MPLTAPEQIHARHARHAKPQAPAATMASHRAAPRVACAALLLLGLPVVSLAIDDGACIIGAPPGRLTAGRPVCLHHGGCLGLMDARQKPENTRTRGEIETRLHIWKWPGRGTGTSTAVPDLLPSISFDLVLRSHGSSAHSRPAWDRCAVAPHHVPYTVPLSHHAHACNPTQALETRP